MLQLSDYREVPAPPLGSGDIRWRTMVRSRLAPGDRYEWLVRLRDGEGRSYGDAAAYVEHRASAPRGGKVIYAWMRLDDVLGPDALYLGLFRLAAGRIQG